MPAPPLTDAELAAVAAVAGREGWTDLARPPGDHPPRSLAEERAVARFQAAVPRARDERVIRMRARLAIAALSVVVLGGCWLVSPTRTAIGLIGAGIFSLIALRRSRRRAEAVARPRRPWSPSGPLRAR
jgi:hypothetical protein